MSVDSVPAVLTPRQEEVKARFIEVRGTWSEAWEAVVRLAPDFLEAYLRFSAVPWRHGPLPVLGVHAVTTSAPLLAEELAARAQPPVPE